MQAAKAAVKDFMSKSGNNDTTVHEKVAPAVTHETVTRTQHDNLQTAIDKEVHQDHYHTSVQPINEKDIRAETHHHKVLPVEHRSFEHDDAKDVKATLASEQAKFRNEQTHLKGEHTSSTQATIAGEHVHHHVHETIQPVVHKQTIEPHITHTTVPIHEVHHNSAQHHASTALPAVSMAEFKKSGGVLSGREERHDGFQGEPRTVGNSLDMGKSMHSTGMGVNNHATTTTNDSKLTSTVPVGATTGMAGTGMTTTGMANNSMSTTDAPLSTTRSGSTTSSVSTKKPSLMDKLNPKKDADMDGKAGIFD